MEPKIQIVSDLHVDFYYSPEECLSTRVVPAADICVVAGDLGEAFDYRGNDLITPTLNLLSEMFKAVVYVPGNHDHWNKHNPRRTLDDIQAEFDNPRVAWLQNSTTALFLTDTTYLEFAGCTMWHYNMPGGNTSLYADYKYITLAEEYISDGVKSCIHTNEQLNVVSLKSQLFLSENTNKNTIVVTHLLPSPQCIDPRFKEARSNRYFVLDCELTMIENDIRMWIHGHTHTSIKGKELTGTNTVVHCNPSGYPEFGPNDTDENPDYDPSYVVDVSHMVQQDTV